ncbi:MAG: excinuclease ABC subunit UvrC, partial [Desulfobacteraceae bacterium]|nr:excinuclease ABC subunit UvrC [Desulfobacteraceae bacterium]
VLKKLNAQMMVCSENQKYEKAGQIRDTIFAIKNVMEKQVVVCPDMKDRDVIAFAAQKGRASITVLMVRSGQLIDTATYPIDLGFKEADEILSAFVEQYYGNNLFLPSFILLSQKIENKEILEQAFSERKSKKVVLAIPMRGEKKRLVEMARLNAQRELEKRILKEEEEQAALVMLKGLLKMEDLPARIECYDNSNLAGQDAVSAMVVFKNGRPHKAGYRKYIIQGLDFQDDYAYMYQVLERRFSKIMEETPYPDLIVVDGGKGQLGMAMAVLKDLKISDKFMVAALAKKNEEKGETDDKIYLPGRSNPLNTSQAKKALYLLQQVRDEAHRFAISFQRRRREKRAELSILDTIKGIGSSRKQMLLKHYKGVTRMKEASLEELAALPGINEKIAGELKKALQQK